MKKTADTREELEWVVGNLFGNIARGYIDDELLKWFNGLQNPGAYELRVVDPLAMIQRRWESAHANQPAAISTR